MTCFKTFLTRVSSSKFELDNIFRDMYQIDDIYLEMIFREILKIISEKLLPTIDDEILSDKKSVIRAVNNSIPITKKPMNSSFTKTENLN